MFCFLISVGILNPLQKIPFHLLLTLGISLTLDPYLMSKSDSKKPTQEYPICVLFSGSLLTLKTGGQAGASGVPTFRLAFFTQIL